MGSETDLHGSVFEKNYFASTRHEVRVHRPSGAIKGEAGAGWPVMSRQPDHAADESETCAAPDRAAGRVRALVKVRMQPAMRIESIQRTQSQNDVDRGQNDVRLGRDGMRAAFLVEFHVRASRGVHSLQACLYQARRSGAKLDLLEREAKLPVSVKPARWHNLRHAAL